LYPTGAKNQELFVKKLHKRPSFFFPPPLCRKNNRPAPSRRSAKRPPPGALPPILAPFPPCKFFYPRRAFSFSPLFYRLLGPPPKIGANKITPGRKAAGVVVFF